MSMILGNDWFWQLKQPIKERNNIESCNMTLYVDDTPTINCDCTLIDTGLSAELWPGWMGRKRLAEITLSNV